MQEVLRRPSQLYEQLCIQSFSRHRSLGKYTISASYCISILKVISETAMPVILTTNKGRKHLGMLFNQSLKKHTDKVITICVIFFSASLFRDCNSKSLHRCNSDVADYLYIYFYFIFIPDALTAATESQTQFFIVKTQTQSITLQLGYMYIYIYVKHTIVFFFFMEFQIYPEKLK